jgi:DNA-directed RNA polymerase alpha subunit
MDRFSNINTTGLVTTALFRTTDVTEANMLRRSILSEIETWAIDLVIFNVNTTPRHDEIVAQRLGLLVIDHSRFIPPETEEYRTSFDVTAPAGVETFELTTQYIPELPFAYETHIVTMKPGQRLACEIVVKKGAAKEHCKWSPVSIVSFTEDPEGYLMRFKSVGMLTPEQILEQGLAKMQAAATRHPITIFSRPVVPHTIPI